MSWKQFFIRSIHFSCLLWKLVPSTRIFVEVTWDTFLLNTSGNIKWHMYDRVTIKGILMNIQFLRVCGLSYPWATLQTKKYGITYRPFLWGVDSLSFHKDERHWCPVNIPSQREWDVAGFPGNCSHLIYRVNFKITIWIGKCLLCRVLIVILWH